jgi:hypothetical protein
VDPAVANWVRLARYDVETAEAMPFVVDETKELVKWAMSLLT